jgi:hypothetical protein
LTTPNVDTYSLPSAYWVSCEPPCYVSGYPANFYQERSQFYNLWPQVLFNQTVATSTGVIFYNFTLGNVPILRNTVIISDSDNSETFTDDGNGVLTGTFGGFGSIDYTTGAVFIQYVVPPAPGQTIRAQYYPYRASRPLTILFFQEQLILRPIPDQVYRIEVQSYQVPTALLSNSDVPALAQWWELLALGAAKKILQSRMDLEQLANCEVLLEKQLDLARRKTLVQLIPECTPTVFNSPSVPFNNINLYPYGG